MKLRKWFSEIRPEFLLLSVVLVLLGSAISLNKLNEDCFDWLKFILTVIGLLLAHISVNVLNDYFDFKSGIDLNTRKTAFSGGSGVLSQGHLNPKTVYIFGISSLALAFPIGIYLTVTSGWQLLPLVFIGGGIIYFYTSHLTKWLIGELFAGLGLGSLPVLGTYYIQTGNYSIEAVIASIAPGLLTANLLFLNEFPDYEADKKGGRYHLAIALGRKKASRLYAVLMITTYVCIIGGVILKFMPSTCFLALTSIPFAIKAMRTSMRYYDNFEKFIPALKANVITVLGTDALLALAYFLA
ncbi:MAG: prenyltransferase [Sedimentisphaerales bacterium]|nr:prenyltransferase [Sedimentisphaerales bacterium]